MSGEVIDPEDTAKAISALQTQSAVLETKLDHISSLLETSIETNRSCTNQMQQQILGLNSSINLIDKETPKWKDFFRLEESDKNLEKSIRELKTENDERRGSEKWTSLVLASIISAGIALLFKFSGTPK